MGVFGRDLRTKSRFDEPPTSQFEVKKSAQLLPPLLDHHPHTSNTLHPGSIHPTPPPAYTTNDYSLHDPH